VVTLPPETAHDDNTLSSLDLVHTLAMTLKSYVAALQTGNVDAHSI
jgi:hypothetical protein